MLPNRSRDGAQWRRLALGVVLALLVVSAGCTGSLSLDGGGGDSATAHPATDVVPAGSDYVVYLDVQSTLTSDALRNLTNTYLGMQAERSYAETPASVSEVMDEVRNDTELDPSGLLSATMFGTTPDSGSVDGVAGEADSAGLVFQATWSEDELVTAVENQSEFSLESSTYAGATLYSPSSETATDSYLGVLGDDQYVVGTEARVKAVLDVSAGDADALGGDVRSAFEDTRDDAHVRFAMDVPQDQVPTDALDGTGGVSNPDIFTEVTTLSGAQYTDGDTVGVEATMTVGDSNTAKDLADVLAGVFAFARQSYGETPAGGLIDRDSLSATQSGSTVTVTSENDVAELNELLQLVAGMGAA